MLSAGGSAFFDRVEALPQGRGAPGPASSRRSSCTPRSSPALSPSGRSSTSAGAIAPYYARLPVPLWQVSQAAGLRASSLNDQHAMAEIAADSELAQAHGGNGARRGSAGVRGPRAGGASFR